MRERTRWLRGLRPVGWGLTTLALALKELREHWAVALLVVGICLAAALLLVVNRVLTGGMGGAFDVLRGLLLFFGVPVAVILGNRLVVHEYKGRTQLFLETLPLRRVHMLAVKYVLGAALLAGLYLAGLALSLFLGMDSDPVGLRHLAIAGSRGAAWLWLAWSACFFLGLLGRYRHVLLVGAVVVLASLDSASTLELARLPPIALVDDTFAYERVSMPWVDLGWTALSSLVLVLGSVGLGLVREGSVAARLSKGHVPEGEAGHRRPGRGGALCLVRGGRAGGARALCPPGGGRGQPRSGAGVAQGMSEQTCGLEVP